MAMSRDPKCTAKGVHIRNTSAIVGCDEPYSGMLIVAALSEVLLAFRCPANLDGNWENSGGVWHVRARPAAARLAQR
jgi:hypothetical protein